MRKFTKWMWAIPLVLGVYAIVHAATTYQRFVVSGNQIYLLQNDGTQTQAGALKFGNDSVTPTLPTTTTGSLYSVKVPVENISATAVTAGMILCSSNTGTAFVGPCVSSDQKTFVGVADGAIAASGGIGYASVAGYAVVLTTAAVAIGDILVSTSATTGYAAANNSFTAGTQIGIAVSAGVTAGGSTLVRLK